MSDPDNPRQFYRRVHMGYGSTYENYILLEVDKGDLKRENKFDYREYNKFRERQLEAYKKTDEYIQQKEKLSKDGYNKKFIDDFLKDFVIQYTSKILVD